MVKALKKILLPGLLPVFFILHGYNAYFGLIPLAVVAKLFLKYILVALIVFAASFILLRKSSKATVFSLFLLSIFFFFGSFYDLLKGLVKPGFITSYTFLLPLILIVIILVFFLLRRSNGTNEALLKYSKYLLLILTVIEAGTFVYKLSAGKSINNIAAKPLEIKTQPSCSNAAKPDIFFVVFDAYTSSKCLQEEFDYSNAYIDSLLKSNNFFTSTGSKSNYNFTPFSVSSTLNMNYLEPGLEDKYISSKLFIQATEAVKNNDVTRFLKDEGYLFKNFSVFDLKDIPAQTKPLINNTDFYNQVDEQTLCSRVWKDIGWNFTTRNIFTGAFRIPKEYKKSKAYHIYRNQTNLDSLLNEIQRESDAPRFVYAHILMPHLPFYFNADGSMVSDTAMILNNYDRKKAYFNQLLYTNQLLAKFIPLASKKSARERVVIIEGDHGARDFKTGTSLDKYFMNLNTYYFSDHNYSMLYDSVSPVNSFRVVLNKYFCQSFPLLKDSSIYFKESEIY